MNLKAITQGWFFKGKTVSNLTANYRPSGTNQIKLFAGATVPLIVDFAQKVFTDNRDYEALEIELALDKRKTNKVQCTISRSSDGQTLLMIFLNSHLNPDRLGKPPTYKDTAFILLDCEDLYSEEFFQLVSKTVNELLDGTLENPNTNYNLS